MDDSIEPPNLGWPHWVILFVTVFVISYFICLIFSIPIACSDGAVSFVPHRGVFVSSHNSKLATRLQI